MISLTDQFQKEIYVDDHLELDFVKASLNTTCTSKNISQQGGKQIWSNELNAESLIKVSQILSSQQNSKPQKKQQGLNKKSRCFMKQISNVLKKNKIKNPSKVNETNAQFSDINFFNFDTDMSSAKLKPKKSSKGSKTNDEINKIITEDRSKKENFNFEQFLQHMVRRKQPEHKIQSSKLEDRKQYKKKNQLKNKTVCLLDLKQPKVSQTVQNNRQKQNIYQSCKIIERSRLHHTTLNKNEEPITHLNFLPDTTNLLSDISRMEIQTVKSSRMMSMKQSRRVQSQRANDIQNSKLQRSLKKAMTNISLTSENFQTFKRANIKTQRPAPVVQQEKQQPVNYAQTMQNIHFDKLKLRVQSKMQDYKKIKEIRDQEDKQKKQFQKKRTFSAQPKLTLTVQGTNLTLNKNQFQASNFKDKDFKHRRPYTALSRTGLEYDRRENYRRRSSDKQHKLTNLAGINNSANHFRTFSKNASREVEELEECKSDRVVRKLKQKYSSRPQTAKSNFPTSRPSTAKASKTQRNSEMSSPRFHEIMEFGKVTKKQIQKQKMKQKLLGLLVECQEEKIYNQNLKQGLNIFEDYCDNIDQGLKTITQQIDQYIRNDQ